MITRVRVPRLRPWAGVAALLLLAAVTGCGGDDPAEPDDDTVVLLDVSRTLTAGVTCDTGGEDAAFTGQAGTTVTIEVSGAASLRPGFVVYAPDFSTQVGAASSNASGVARLSLALAESGQYHLTICEANAAGGSVRVRVTRPRT